MLAINKAAQKFTWMVVFGDFKCLGKDNKDDLNLTHIFQFYMQIVVFSNLLG